MRISKPEELRLIRTGLEALRKARHSRIMRGKAEVVDGREYIVLCHLLERVEEALEQQRQEAIGIIERIAPSV